jgi:hypothetical protein
MRLQFNKVAVVKQTKKTMNASSFWHKSMSGFEGWKC